MLMEFNNLSQNDMDSYRRLFSDEYFDLYIWYSKEGSKLGFQLCYDKNKYERAVTYTFGKHYSHLKVDGGENGYIKGTPILVADGMFDKNSIIDRFSKESIQIPQDIREYVIKKLVDCDVW